MSTAYVTLASQCPASQFSNGINLASRFKSRRNAFIRHTQVYFHILLELTDAPKTLVRGSNSWLPALSADAKRVPNTVGRH